MSGRLGTDSRFVETLFSTGTACGITDAQLLERFVAREGEAAEAAFETLVLRHGSMVFDVCLKILGNTHDAQDAFQATFLVLATRASSIVRRGSVASWLHGVALRVARRARTDAARRVAHEKQIAELTRSEVEPSGAENGHDFEMLHDEIERLPGKYREAVVLCYLEGMSLEAAAGQVGCPIGTVGVRLMRAKERLKIRLSARGMSVPAGLLVAGTVARSASAALPSALVGSAVNAVMDKANGGIVSLAADKLTVGVLGSMVRSKLSKRVLGVIVAVVAVGFVAGLVVHSGMLNASQRPNRNATDARSSWIGQQVITKYGVLVMTGNHVANKLWPIVYTVKEVDGERVRLDSKDDTGWIDSNRIVPLVQAIKFYTEELLANSDNARAQLERGRIRAMLHKEDEAIADFTEAIRLDPNQAYLYLWRATTYRVKKSYDEAIADFTEAIRLDPSFAASFCYRGQSWADKAEYDKAIEDFTLGIRLDPKSALNFSCRGRAAIFKGEYDQAVADLTQAIRLDPTDAIAYTNRAIARERKPRSMHDDESFDKIFADLTEAIRLDPTNSVAYLYRGRTFQQTGDPQKAIEDITQSIRLDPACAWAYLCRGILREQMRDQINAIADYGKKVQLDPNDAEAYFRRAYIWSTSLYEKQRDGKKAVESAIKACELTNWKNSKYLETLAAAYAEAGDFKSAVNWQTKANDLHSDQRTKNMGEGKLRFFKDKKRYHTAETSTWHLQ